MVAHNKRRIQDGKDTRKEQVNQEYQEKYFKGKYMTVEQQQAKRQLDAFGDQTSVRDYTIERLALYSKTWGKSLGN